MLPRKETPTRKQSARRARAAAPTVVVPGEIGLPVGRAALAVVGLGAEFLVELGPAEDVDLARQQSEQSMHELERVVAIGTQQKHGGTGEALVLKGGDLDLRGEIHVGVRSEGQTLLEGFFLQNALVGLLVEQPLLGADGVGVGEVEVARLCERNRGIETFMMWFSMWILRALMT